MFQIRVYETTYTVPRFNAAAGQTTVLFIQNPTDQAVSGTVYFWSPAGVPLAESVFFAPAKGAAALSTASVAGVAGQSGTITITHDAPYGALVGKAVALDPATGFSFDTPMVPRVR